MILEIVNQCNSSFVNTDLGPQSITWPLWPELKVQKLCTTSAVFVNAVYLSTITVLAYLATNKIGALCLLITAWNFTYYTSRVNHQLQNRNAAPEPKLASSQLLCEGWWHFREIRYYHAVARIDPTSKLFPGAQNSSLLLAKMERRWRKHKQDAGVPMQCFTCSEHGQLAEQIGSISPSAW